MVNFEETRRFLHHP
jgi:hypothetical protein